MTYDIRNVFALIFLIAFGALIFMACQKAPQDTADPEDPRLQQPYCNDPEAVNYNWDFPGRPDNSVCYYPTDVFAGRYQFEDTLYYSSEYIPMGTRTYTLELEAQGRSNMLLKGFCDDGKAFTMKAGRFFRATLDSLSLADSLMLGGQFFCSTQDTLSGYILYRSEEPEGIRIQFRQGTDTNAIFHTGTAWRLP